LPLATIGWAIAVALEIGGGLMLVLDLRAREVAFGLAVFVFGNGAVFFTGTSPIYDGTRIRLQQSKTGRRIVMPAGAPLDMTERPDPVILTNSLDAPQRNGRRAAGDRRRHGAADRDVHRP
jgi:hypothetical protein